MTWFAKKPERMVSVEVAKLRQFIHEGVWRVGPGNLDGKPSGLVATRGPILISLSTGSVYVLETPFDTETPKVMATIPMTDVEKEVIREDCESKARKMMAQSIDAFLNAPQAPEHWSDCAVHNEPAFPAGECNCGGYKP